MVCPVNKLIVVLDKKFQDEIFLPSGLTLYQETKFRPEHHVTTIGKVVSVPDMLTKYENRDIANEVQVGDEICFNYQVVYDVDDLNTHLNLFYNEGQPYWFVDYHQVFCVKRGDEIIPIGGNVMLEEIKCDVLDTFKNSFLLMPESMKAKVEKNKAIVRHIGTPLNGEPKLKVVSGDVVFFRRDVGQEYEIYGNKLIVVGQKYLMATAICLLAKAI